MYHFPTILRTDPRRYPKISADGAIGDPVNERLVVFMETDGETAPDGTPGLYAKGQKQIFRKDVIVLGGFNSNDPVRFANAMVRAWTSILHDAIYAAGANPDGTPNEITSEIVED
jgi:hypothetical protein